MKKSLYKCRRVIMLFVAVAFLFSSIPPFTEKPKEVKANAISVPIAGGGTTLGSLVQLAIYIAAVAAGTPSGKVLTSPEKAGINSEEDAKAYIEKYYGSESDFGKMILESGLSADECAKFMQTTGTIIDPSYLEELMETAKKDSAYTDGSSALALNDAFSVNGSAIVIEFPNNNNNTPEPSQTPSSTNVPDSDVDPEPVQGEKAEIVFPTSTVPGLMGTPLFQHLYYLSRKILINNANDNLSSDGKNAKYSFDYWENKPNFFLFESAGMTEKYPIFKYVSIYFNDMFFGTSSSRYDNPCLNLYETAKLYPCYYYDKEKDTYRMYVIGSNGMPTTNSYCGAYLYYKNANGSSSLYYGVRNNCIDIDLDNIFTTNEFGSLATVIKNEFISRMKARDVGFNPTESIEMDMLNVGNEENFLALKDLVSSGNYTTKEILELMEDGWKGLETTHRSGVDDKGETAKKTLDDPEKGEKYKTKGKDAKGKEQKGISLDSLAKGVEAAGVGEKGAIASEIVGDPIKGTPIERPNPPTVTNPDANPGTNPGTDPGTNPDTDPGTNPGTDPGTNPDTDPGTNPGTDPGTNPDTDPGTNPGTAPGTNPGTDPGTNPGTDPGTNPGTDPGTNPDTDSKDKPDDIDPNEVPSLIKKFPFCVPWDLIDLFTTLSAESKAPRFEIPFKMNNKLIKVDEKIIIDFADFEKLAVICRWFFRIAFILGLILLTRYIIKA